MQNAETIRRPAKKTKMHRGVMIVATIVAVLVGIGWMWWSGLTRMPVVTIPTPTMPSPNAFDLITQACNGIQEEKAVGEALSTRPITGQHIYTQAEKEALLAKNAEPLKKLRAAFSQGYMHPPARSMSVLFPHFAKNRSMARLLALESQVYASRSEWGRAINSDLDAMELGVTIPRGAILIGQLVGVACEAIGRKSAWENVEKLSASEAKAAANRLEKMIAKRFPYADTMEEEKRCGQAGLLEMFRDPNWRNKTDWFQAFNSSGGMDFGEKVEEFSLKARLYLYSNGAIFNNYSGHMDRLIARERQPYAVQGPPPPVPNDPVSEILMPVFEQASIKDLTTQVQDALLLVTLALHAYHLEHGAYPQQLNALAPNYLAKLPGDPFGQGTFLYKRTGDRYLLYSVGPDRVDDGGRPIDDPSKASGSNSNARYYIQLDSKGDVVVGVNKY